MIERSHRIWFFFFFSLVGLICSGRPVHWHAADPVWCGHHVVHQVLLLWESQYLATNLIGSGARIFWKLNRAEFHLFCKCLFECLVSIFSQIYTHNLLLISFQTVPVLNYCSTSWLSFRMIFISVVFFSCLNCYYLVSFYAPSIQMSCCFLLKIVFNCAEFHSFCKCFF